MNYNQRYGNENYNWEENDQYQREFKQQGKKSCCVRKVEETYCCYPSYYNEDKEDKIDDKKERHHDCWEGTFRLCPQKSYCDNKRDEYDYKKENDYEDKKNYHYNNKEEYWYNDKKDYQEDYNKFEDKHNKCDKHEDKKDDRKEENDCRCRNHNRCCFGLCGLFRNWRW